MVGRSVTDKLKKSDSYYNSEPIEETIKRLVRETINKRMQHQI